MSPRASEPNATADGRLHLTENRTDAVGSKYSQSPKWIGRGPCKVTRPIVHVGVDVRR